MEGRRFFEGVVAWPMRRPDHDGVRLLSAFMVLAGLSATLMDEVTSTLFTSPATRILPVVREGASPHPPTIEKPSELVQGHSPWYETGGWHEESGGIGT